MPRDFSDDFVTHMLATALWSSIDDEGEPLDADHDIDGIDPGTRERLEREARVFYAEHRLAIHCDGAPLANDFEGPLMAREAAMAGHDFWLTRCGHGAGFWDGDWPEPAASILDRASRQAGNVDLYVGDDGLIYA
jgi:hypothetical protein